MILGCLTSPDLGSLSVKKATPPNPEKAFGTFVAELGMAVIMPSQPAPPGGNRAHVEAAHITLQLMGFPSVLQAQLFWVAGVLRQWLPIEYIAGQLLASLGLEEARLVSATMELGATFGKVLPVLIVTLEPADSEEVHHPRVVTDAAISNL